MKCSRIIVLVVGFILGLCGTVLAEQNANTKYTLELQELIENNKIDEAAQLVESQLEKSRKIYTESAGSVAGIYYKTLTDAMGIYIRKKDNAKVEKYFLEKIAALEQDNPLNRRILGQFYAQEVTPGFVPEADPRTQILKQYAQFLIFSTDTTTSKFDSVLAKIKNKNDLPAANCLIEIIQYILDEAPETIFNTPAELTKISALAATIYSEKLPIEMLDENFYDVRTINYAANALYDTEKYDKALLYYEKAVSKTESYVKRGMGEVLSAFSAVGSITSPNEISSSLSPVVKLAVCYYKTGQKDKFYENYTKYLTNFQPALNKDYSPTEGNRHVFQSKEHPQNRLVFRKFADMFLGYGDIATAQKLYKLSADSSIDFIGGLSGTFYPEEWRFGLAVRMKAPFNRLIEIAQKNPQTGYVQEAYEEWINYKGYLISFDKEMMSAIEHLDDRESLSLYKKYLESKKLLTGLTEKQILADEKLAQVLLAKMNSETLLSRRIMSLKSFSPWVNISDLRKKMPTGSVYIDFAKVTEFDENLQKDKDDAYYAFVVKNAPDSVELVRVGSATEIDSAVHQFHSKIKQALASRTFPDARVLTTLSQQVYDVVFSPLSRALSGAHQLIISPDGALNVMPFEALSNQGEYLANRYTISYVPSSLELIRSQAAGKKKGKLVIFADPDFDARGSNQGNPVVAAVAANRTRALPLAKLPETDAEAKQIALAFGKNHKVQIFEGKDANEDELLQVENPEILHIATHGFYRKDDGSDLNPAQRSGLYLSGANASFKSGSDYGIVSADKLSRLPLSKTSLVALSACSTGVGDIKDSEGVFGLERAFLTSGAASLLVSLWDVPSNESVELMVAFYQNLEAGMPKSEALVSAKKELMKKYPNPFFWAPFVLVGSPL